MPLVGAFFYAIAAFQLIFFALSWIHLLTEKQIIIGLSIGLVAGVGKYFGVFHKLNKKNIIRINNADERQKLFSVFPKATYFVILAMISLGISLRIIFNVSRAILMPVYLAIGIALLMSCLYYFIIFSKHKKSVKY